LRDPDRFDAWLHRLTVHACIDVARHRRRRVIEVELTPLDDLPVADASRLVDDRDFLDRALQRLEPEQRAVIVLRFYLDLSLMETADALGVPLGTAKSRLHRALAQMRINVALEDEPTASSVTQGRFA
jgi:RNA polymerase sigma-70 factor (ECF subfamily)